MHSRRGERALGLADGSGATDVARAGVGPGSGLRSTPFTTENTAVVAPIVRPSVPITATAKPGRRACWRTAMRRSFRTAAIEPDASGGDPIEVRQKWLEIRHSRRQAG